jgi:hypothetical protein
MPLKIGPFSLGPPSSPGGSAPASEGHEEATYIDAIQRSAGAEPLRKPRPVKDEIADHADSEDNPLEPLAASRPTLQAAPDTASDDTVDAPKFEPSSVAELDQETPAQGMVVEGAEHVQSSPVLPDIPIKSDATIPDPNNVDSPFSTGIESPSEAASSLLGDLGQAGNDAPPNNMASEGAGSSEDLAPYDSGFELEF